jgi:hypothetical protein
MSEFNEITSAIEVNESMVNAIAAAVVMRLSGRVVSGKIPPSFASILRENRGNTQYFTVPLAQGNGYRISIVIGRTGDLTIALMHLNWEVVWEGRLSDAE